MNLTTKEKQFIIDNLSRLSRLCGAYDKFDYAMRDQIIEKLQNEDKESNFPVVPKHYGGVYGSSS
jgi:hypothetical protein